MILTATEFKARCLAILDAVKSRQETVTITKRGRVVARLIPAADSPEQPWLRLRESPALWHGDPLAPAIHARDVDVLKK